MLATIGKVAQNFREDAYMYHKAQQSPAVPLPRESSQNTTAPSRCRAHLRRSHHRGHEEPRVAVSVL